MEPNQRAPESLRITEPVFLSDQLYRARAAFERRPRGFGTKTLHGLCGRHTCLGTKCTREMPGAHRGATRELLD
jgi:hypothetical protein